MRMKQAMLLASAAMLAISPPAMAKPDHAAKLGKGQPVKVVKDWGRNGYGIGGCPPGLAKKNPRCMPPGQYKKLFEVGQRVPSGYRGLLGYNALPHDLRTHYGPAIDPSSRYIYDNNYLYRVDPTTMVVSEILRAVL